MAIKNFIPTRKSLLSRLKNWDDQASWKDFFDTYWRLIYNTARKAGLNDPEAQDVVQETVISVSRKIPEFKYDPDRCSFKSWLLRLVQWRIVDQFRKRMPGMNQIPFDDQADPLDGIEDGKANNLDKIWNEEWEHYLVDRALEAIKGRINPKHFQVFHLLYVRNWTVARIAKQLNVTRPFIYLVKHRVSKMFEEEIQRLNKTPEVAGGVF